MVKIKKVHIDTEDEEEAVYIEYETDRGTYGTATYETRVLSLTEDELQALKKLKRMGVQISEAL